MKSYKLFNFNDIWLGLIAIFSSIFIVTFLTCVFFAPSLQSKESVMNRNNTGLTLVDKNDVPFFSFYSANAKKIIPLSQIPKKTQESVIAVEDKTFYTHSGFSLKSMVGAVVADVRLQSFAYGGSTITQQLVKNSLLNNHKDFFRKYQEFILAQEIENKFSKDEILEMYLNSVYFGEGAFGIEEASNTYFGKSAKDLDVAESALLTALLPAPSRLSPRNGDFEQAKERQKFVLSQMLNEGYITKEEEEKAASEQLVLANSTNNMNYLAPHFALMVRDELIKKYGEETVARSGFKVKTTLDLDLQKKAEEVVNTQVNNLSRNNVSNGAAIMEDPKTGEILALVGSKDWNNEKFGKVNITTSLRSPGSSFKPIVYSEALTERKITPGTILNDSPITYKPGAGVSDSPYSPQDYDRKFRGKVTVRRALVNSLNIPAVEVMSKVGVPSTLQMAKNLGITTLKDPSNYGLSLTLGTGEVKLLEMTNVYATFANEGMYNPTVLISQIQDKNNKVLYEYSPKPRKAMDPEVAFLISSILSDNKTRAEEFGSTLNISKPAAVKTGTAEDYKDALTLGYTPNITVGVWVGNNSGEPMDKIAGSLGAAPIWKQLMEEYLSKTKYEAFKIPPGVIAAAGCSSTAFNFIQPVLAEEVASPSASPTPVPTVKEYYIKGTEPKKLFCPTPSPSPNPSTSPSPSPTEQAASTNPPTPPEEIKQPDPTPQPTPPTEMTGAGGPMQGEEGKKNPDENQTPQE